MNGWIAINTQDAKDETYQRGCASAEVTEAS